VCGDLSSAFDFSTSVSAAPTLPSTTAYQPPDADRHDDYIPTPPTRQRVPKQEAGVRPSRPLGYRLRMKAQVKPGGLTVTIVNAGRLGAQLQARSNDVAGAPFSYTVGAGHTLERTLRVKGRYDVSFHGPHGFFRRFAGRTTAPLLEVHPDRDGDHLVLHLYNHRAETVRAHVADAYAADQTVNVPAHQSRRVRLGLAATHGWYDALVTVPGHGSFARALAGRIETGRPSTSDPQLGR
jgi:phospholipase C